MGRIVLRVVVKEFSLLRCPSFLPSSPHALSYCSPSPSLPFSPVPLSIAIDHSNLSKLLYYIFLLSLPIFLTPTSIYHHLHPVYLLPSSTPTSFFLPLPPLLATLLGCQFVGSLIYMLGNMWKLH